MHFKIGVATIILPRPGYLLYKNTIHFKEKNCGSSAIYAFENQIYRTNARPGFAINFNSVIAAEQALGEFKAKTALKKLGALF